MEIWVKIKNYNTYSISSLGKIRNDRTKNILKHQIGKTGYYTVKLWKDKKLYKKNVHRLLAENFIYNPNSNYEVNHINGIRTDNRLENLEWVSHQYNMIHCINLGLRKTSMGETHHKAKLTEKDVLEIRELIKQKVKNVDIAKQYSVTSNTISMIKCKRNWKHL